MKIPSRFALFCALMTTAIVPLLSCSPSLAADTVEVGSFQQIEIMDAVNVYLTQGPAKPAVIEADGDATSHVQLDIRGSVLHVISSESRHREVRVYLTAPEVNGLSIYGSGDLKLIGKLSAKDIIRISVAGSGTISGELNAPTINASIAGAGDIKIKGKTRDLRVSIAGSGDYDGLNLMAENTRVSIVGSGDANVYASKELSVSIAGSGDVSYLGEPQLRSSIMGSGSVKKR